MATTIAPTITKERIVELRTNIVALKNKLEAHFGSRADAHVEGTLDYPGFMSSKLYSELLGVQAEIDKARKAVESNDVPAGLMLYWYGDAAKVPEGYKLCNGSNDTLRFDDRYIKPCIVDKNTGSVGGTDKLNEIPLPRHRHAFQNYCESEVYSELAGRGNSLTKRKSFGGLCGSECSGTWNIYPLCYTDYTGYTGSTATPSIKVVPPYVALHIIKREPENVIYTADGVGTVKINLGKTIPVGFLELNGDWVDATYYVALYRYASSHGLLVTEAEYNSMVNSTGSCGSFVYNDSTKMLRLPLMRGILKFRGIDGAESSKSTPKGSHFHGMGPMWDNNGNWGRLSYTGVGYPSGAKGWYWNGRGGHSTYEEPPYDGAIITSYEINVGTTGNGEICDSMNVSLIICAFHEYASTMASAAVVEDFGFEDEAAALDEIGVITSSVSPQDMAYSNPEEIGWRIEPGGRIFTWGFHSVETSGTQTIPFPIGFENAVFNVSVNNASCGYTDVHVVSVDNNGFTVVMSEDNIGNKIIFEAFGR